jgi:hypothetical protein
MRDQVAASDSAMFRFTGKLTFGSDVRITGRRGRADACGGYASSTARNEESMTLRNQSRLRVVYSLYSIGRAFS